MKSRQLYNQEILRMLEDYLAVNLDVRFSQALINLGIVKVSSSSTAQPRSVSTNAEYGMLIFEDNFYEESRDTLQRMKGLGD